MYIVIYTYIHRHCPNDSWFLKFSKFAWMVFFLKFPMNIYLTRMIGQSHDISNNDPDGPMVGNALGVKVRVVSFYMLDIPEECSK